HSDPDRPCRTRRSAHRPFAGEDFASPQADDVDYSAEFIHLQGEGQVRNPDRRGRQAVHLGDAAGHPRQAAEGLTMFSGLQMAAELTSLGITHVVWLPDSTLGQWEEALSTARGLKLIRVCREGEAWAIAAGLHLGGARPLVMIQCTGLFESGDSLRNAVFDY